MSSDVRSGNVREPGTVEAVDRESDVRMTPDAAGTSSVRRVNQEPGDLDASSTSPLSVARPLDLSEFPVMIRPPMELVSRREFSPSRLRFETVVVPDFEVRGPGAIVQESGVSQQRWQYEMQAWSEYCLNRVSFFQSNNWHIHLENQGLQETVQYHTQLLQEVKSYTDSNFTELWSKLLDIWSKSEEFQKNLVQQCLALSQEIPRQEQCMKQVHSMVSRLLLEQLPELVKQTDCRFQDLAQKTHVCICQVQEKINALISELQGTQKFLHQVGQGLNDVSVRVQLLEGRPPPESAMPGSGNISLTDLQRIEAVISSLVQRQDELALAQVFDQPQVFRKGVEQFINEASLLLGTLRSEIEDVKLNDQSGNLERLDKKVISLSRVVETLEANSLDHWCGQLQARLDSQGQMLQDLSGQVRRMQTQWQESQEERTVTDEVRQSFRDGRMGPGSPGFSSHPGDLPPSLTGCYTASTELEGGVNGGRDYNSVVSSPGLTYSIGYRDQYQTPELHRATLHYGYAGTPTHGGFSGSSSRLRCPLDSHLPGNPPTVGVGHSNHFRNYPGGQGPDPRFDSGVHRIVNDMLRVDSWNGKWSDLDDWLVNWKLYLQAGCVGINPQAQILMFLDRLPKQYADFLRSMYLAEHWSQDAMIDWLLRMRDIRMPFHLRLKSWQNLLPSGSSYQHLVTWYQKWKGRTDFINVTESQILDQFDLCVKSFFSAGLTEVLKAEQELKFRVGMHAKIPLEERFQLLLRTVAIADNVRALNGGASSGYASTVDSHSSRHSGPGYRHSVREVQSKSDQEETCYYCQKPGHRIGGCPDRYRHNLKHGNCLRCGKSGHRARDCPRSPGKLDSGSSGGSVKSGDSRSSARVKPQREVVPQFSGTKGGKGRARSETSNSSGRSRPDRTPGRFRKPRSSSPRRPPGNKDVDVKNKVKISEVCEVDHLDPSPPNSEL